jgi:hypothetical protein
MYRICMQFERTLLDCAQIYVVGQSAIAAPVAHRRCCECRWHLVRAVTPALSLSLPSWPQTKLSGFPRVTSSLRTTLIPVTRLIGVPSLASSFTALRTSLPRKDSSALRIIKPPGRLAFIAGMRLSLRALQIVIIKASPIRRRTLQHLSR